jgi:hypothetical protein
MQTIHNSEVHAQLPPGQRAMADFPRFIIRKLKLAAAGDGTNPHAS